MEIVHVKVRMSIFASIARVFDADDSNPLDSYAEQRGFYTRRFEKNVDPWYVLEDSSRTRNFLTMQTVFSVETIGVYKPVIQLNNLEDINSSF
jgi:hypothetical protein